MNDRAFAKYSKLPLLVFVGITCKHGKYRIVPHLESIVLSDRPKVELNVEHSMKWPVFGIPHHIFKISQLTSFTERNLRPLHSAYLLPINPYFVSFIALVSILSLFIKESCRCPPYFVFTFCCTTVRTLL